MHNLIHCVIIDYVISAEHVQILFVEERQLWVTTAVQKGEICIAPSTELQIAQMYGDAADSHGLLVSVATFQQQELTNTCGLFAIAAAYHYAVKDDLGTISFKEDRMRNHLLQCFQKEKLRRFPQAESGQQVKRARSQFILWQKMQNTRLIR